MALALSIIYRQGFLIHPRPLRRRSSALQLNLNIHSRIDSTCTYTLLLRYSLHDHLQQNYRPIYLMVLSDAMQSQTNGLRCTHCGDTFQRKGHLQRHLLRHTGSKSYRCHSCSKSFSRRCVIFSDNRYMSSLPCAAIPYVVIRRCMTDKFLVRTTI